MMVVSPQLNECWVFQECSAIADVSVSTCSFSSFSVAFWFPFFFMALPAPHFRLLVSHILDMPL